MAIYHFSGQVISRSKGRSAVAAAAYRAAAAMLDERTGLTHDFTQKNDVLETAILLPSTAPAWMKDRDLLWNAVEQSEKRKDSQSAREFNIALPLELTHEQNWAMALAFVQKTWVDKGMVAEVYFHQGHRGQEEQPHLHVMLTMREVTAQGFGEKVRSWNDKTQLLLWREEWAQHCNLTLALHEIDVRIDHRTLEAQGINLEPQNKRGAKLAGERNARFIEHQAIAKVNAERILADPSIALQALTQQQSTFSHRDIARFVHRHTVSAEEFTQVYAVVLASPELVPLSSSAEAGQKRFTTQKLMGLEKTMVEYALEKAESKGHRVSERILRKAQKSRSLSQEQIAALTHLTRGDDLACVVGFAGSGKSYLLGAAREAFEAAGYNVQGMTLSGAAAENLEESSGIKSRTIASHLWHWQQGKERFNERDVIVVDEAGMVDSQTMLLILEEVRRANAKILLIGDTEQLQAIGAGAALRAILERVGYVELNEIRRQKEQWQQEATREFATQRTEQALQRYEEQGHMHQLELREDAMDDLLMAWNKDRKETEDELKKGQSEKVQIILAYTNRDVLYLNEGARAWRKADGELQNEQTVMTAKGKRQFSVGERIYFLKNENTQLLVKNGTIGTIQKIDGDNLSVLVDKKVERTKTRLWGRQKESGVKEGQAKESRLVTFNIKDYDEVDYAYAATVYKAQGLTVDKSYVLATSNFDRNSTYVAMTRHKERVDVFYGAEDFKDSKEMRKSLSVKNHKELSLDHTDISQEGQSALDFLREAPSQVLTKGAPQEGEKEWPKIYRKEARNIMTGLHAIQTHLYKTSGVEKMPLQTMAENWLEKSGIRGKAYRDEMAKKARIENPLKLHSAEMGELLALTSLIDAVDHYDAFEDKRQEAIHRLLNRGIQSQEKEHQNKQNENSLALYEEEMRKIDLERDGSERGIFMDINIDRNENKSEETDRDFGLFENLPISDKDENRDEGECFDFLEQYEKEFSGHNNTEGLVFEELENSREFEPREEKAHDENKLEIESNPVDKGFPIEKGKQNFRSISKERLEAAEKRLAEKLHKKLVALDLEKEEKEMGLKFEMILKEGDFGVYRGNVKINNESYGIIEQEGGQAKLVPDYAMESRKIGEEMLIAKGKEGPGNELLKAVQPKVQARALARAKEFEQDTGRSW